jgi:hypothetical protein
MIKEIKNNTEYFYIYKNGIFQNKEKLNEIGKKTFDIFLWLKKNNASYFDKISDIYVTSLYRSKSKTTNAHKKNMAVDIVIRPIEYTAYFAGVLHACYPYNIYLGTRNKDKNLNRHLHIDNDYSIYKNKMAFEFIKPENYDNDIISLSKIVSSNIDWLMNLYEFSYFSTPFKSGVKYLLLTNYDLNDKLQPKEFTEIKGKSFFDSFTDTLKETGDALTKLTWLVGIIGGLYIINKTTNMFKKGNSYGRNIF